jgi:hypothetical protein
MPPDSEIAKLVERQMRNWEIARQQCPEFEQDPEQKQVEDFVTISRQVASGGYVVAQLLGQRLGWPVFDKEILHHMAGDFRKEDYFHRLSEAVLALARQGPAVFLGRGADCILPQDRGLRVRLLAPQEARVREFARRGHCDQKAAQARIAETERERDEFFRNHFNTTRFDLTRFDLLINLGRVSHDHAVELIITALHLRGAKSQQRG